MNVKTINKWVIRDIKITNKWNNKKKKNGTVCVITFAV